MISLTFMISLSIRILMPTDNAEVAVTSNLVLDLDILDYKGKIINKGNILQIPHPRMGKRDFILKPLHDLSPYWTDPINGKPIKSLIYKCKRSNISIAKAI